MSNLHQSSAIALASMVLAQSFGGGAASAESLADKMRAARAPTTPALELNVGCGKLKKANCNVVVSSIAANLPSNITLKPEETDGSHMSAEAVCLGFAKAAVGQADTFKAVGQSAECVNKFEPIGQPLYPYVGFMIVRANYPHDYFSEMIEHRKGKAIKIAAGDSGSGGHDTLQAIKDYHSYYTNAITRETAAPDTALDRLTDGQLDAFFAMDAPDSKFIADVKSRVDKYGNPLFKFLSLDLPSDFYASSKNTFGTNILYTREKFDIPGWIFKGETLSTPAMLIVNRAFREENKANGDAVTQLRRGAIEASPTIRERTGTPENWSAPGLSRQ